MLKYWLAMGGAVALASVSQILLKKAAALEAPLSPPIEGGRVCGLWFVFY